jgi:hypothetical protein
LCDEHIIARRLHNVEQFLHFLEKYQIEIGSHFSNTLRQPNAPFPPQIRPRGEYSAHNAALTFAPTPARTDARE